ncbi:MAG: SpoIIE family protein phosphatase [Bacteroidetes bacterium]|nr:SpoIIE family protein phosphatase [Bacteroidota bacterium]
MKINNLLTFTLVLMVNSFVFSQQRKIETGDFFISNYSRSFLNTDYLNWSIVQDSEGIIYYGNSQKGVQTFDGQKVRPVLDEKGEPTERLGRSLVTDSKKTTYAIIGAGFGYIEKNKFNEPIYYSLSDKLPEKDKVNSTLWSSGVLNDTIFFSSEKSVYLYKDKKLLSVQHFENVVHTVAVNKGGAFLRIWGEGIYKLNDGKFKYLPSSKKIFAENRIDEQYSLDNGDQLLVSRNVGLWYLKKDGSFVKAESKDVDNFAIINESYGGGSRLKDGTIPITTTKGGVIFIDDNLKVKSILNQQKGLTDVHVTNLFQDRTGDIWGTNFGLFRLSFDSTLTYFSKTNNLVGFVGDILRSNGKLFVKTSDNLFEFKPRNSVYEKSEFKPNNVNDLGGDIIEFDDQIISTNNYDITATKNGKTEVISPLYRSGNTIRSKINPNIIFSSNPVYGLLAHQYTNGKWSALKLAKQDSIKPRNIKEVAPGKILALTREGIFIYDYNKSGQGNFTKLGIDKQFTQSGRLNLATFNESTHVLVDSLYNHYKLNLEKYQAELTNIKIDTLIAPEGQLSYAYNPDSKNGWIITETGLYKTAFDFDKGYSFTKYPFYKVSLSELSGALYAEGSGESEILWIGSQEEKLYRFYPELAIKEKRPSYKALIRAIYTNGQKAPLDLGDLPFSNNNLLFEVAYPVFGNESKTMFSYWLEGQDKTWSEFVPDFKKEYTNLREGNYTFRVRAMDASGQISEEGILEFKISPPWYRTLWAYGFYLLTLVLAFLQFGKFQAKKSFLKAENERKNSELAAAKDLQNRLLPKTLPVVKNLDIAGYLRTSTEVGGDYYDFFEHADGSLFAICGDATGHGTPSGMLVSITKAGIIGLPQMSPKDMLHELNRVVKKVDLGILRMSLNIALIKDNQLTLSSAGMPPYYIYRAATGTTEEIQISGIPLGSFNDVYFDQIDTTFNSGDILVIISDGLPEAPNLTGDLFDYQKLQDLITTYGNLTAREVINQLMIEADAWLSGKHNPDDITLVVIKRK